MTPIIVHSKPNCRQCDATKRKLTALDANYIVVDITQDQAALDHIESLGYTAAPVVIAGDMHWSGYSPDKCELAVVAQRAGGIEGLEPAAIAEVMA